MGIGQWVGNNQTLMGHTVNGLANIFTKWVSTVMAREKSGHEDL